MSSLVLLGTCGSDVHSVANNLLEKCLTDAGVRVRNLGVAVPVTEWAESITMMEPDLVLIGSMNGDLQPLVELINSIEKAGHPKNRILIGGKFRLGSDGPSLIPFLSAMGVMVVESENPSFASLSLMVIEKLKVSQEETKARFGN